MSLSLTIFGYPGNLSKLHITAYLLISIGIFAVHLHDFHLRSSPQTPVFTRVASAEALQSRKNLSRKRVITYYAVLKHILKFSVHHYQVLSSINKRLFVVLLLYLSLFMLYLRSSFVQKIFRSCDNSLKASTFFASWISA